MNCRQNRSQSQGSLQRHRVVPRALQLHHPHLALRHPRGAEVLRRVLPGVGRRALRRGTGQTKRGTYIHPEIGTLILKQLPNLLFHTYWTSVHCNGRG